MFAVDISFVISYFKCNRLALNASLVALNVDSFLSYEHNFSVNVVNLLQFLVPSAFFVSNYYKSINTNIKQAK